MVNSQLRLVTQMLDAAQSAHNKLVDPSISDEEFELSWCMFLITNTSFYQKLNLATKGQARFRELSERLKNLQKSDQLLVYLNKLRNTTEHRLISPVDLSNQFRLVFRSRVTNPDPEKEKAIKAKKAADIAKFEEELAHLYRRPKAYPVDAIDRSKDGVAATVKGPLEHLGGTLPTRIAIADMSYLSIKLMRQFMREVNEVLNA